jgi:hypothetical protein
MVNISFRMSMPMLMALKIAARIQHRPLASLMRAVVRDYLADFSYARSEIAITKILALTQVIKRLVAYGHVLKVPLQTRKGLGSQLLTNDERRRKRRQLLEMGLDAFEKLYKITRSEDASEKAKHRVQAYQVLARLGSFNAALLRDETDEEILSYMVELDEENERLETMAKEIQARATQEAESSHKPTSPADSKK